MTKQTLENVNVTSRAAAPVFQVEKEAEADEKEEEEKKTADDDDGEGMKMTKTMTLLYLCLIICLEKHKIKKVHRKQATYQLMRKIREGFKEMAEIEAAEEEKETPQVLAYRRSTY